jgi:hypothetical protein
MQLFKNIVPYISRWLEILLCTGWSVNCHVISSWLSAVFGLIYVGFGIFCFSMCCCSVMRTDLSVNCCGISSGLPSVVFSCG